MASRKAGKHEEATTFRADNVVAIKSYKSLQAIKGAIANVNKRVRAVEVSNIDADKKREEIRRLNKLKDQFAKRLVA